LKTDEIAYIIKDGDNTAFFTAQKFAQIVAAIPAMIEGLQCYCIDGSIERFKEFEESVAVQPVTPIDDESSGQLFLYSSGSTGRPKGILRPLPTIPPDEQSASEQMLSKVWGFGPDTVYLHPAPLYHSAPIVHALVTLAFGGTFVLLRHFDPQLALESIDRYQVTICQWVPTMFIRMLKLPEDIRARQNLGSLKVAFHGAAPCPVDVKRSMLDWWGPIISEFYSATEANGYCRVTAEEWLKKPGTVGKPLSGEIHIIGEDGNEVPVNTPGTIYFGAGGEFEYHNDSEKNKETRHPLGWTTVGDMGYVDEDGYLFLTDRRDFMIISGGVNIYPAEAENVLHAHPEVVDVAVIGVPNAEFGEEVKAIVQPAGMALAGPELEAELIRFCRDRIADVKCPRSVDFVEALPRLPTGKLQKKLLRAPYWANAGELPGGRHKASL
jgi:acyl-CoA synthetase (AMP-forming)/AMP-acid ligase II